MPSHSPSNHRCWYPDNLSGCLVVVFNVVDYPEPQRGAEARGEGGVEGKSTTSVGRTGSSKGKASLARQTPRFIRPPGCRAQPWIATRPRPPVKILLSRSFPPPNSPIEPLPSANYVRKSPAHLSSGQVPPKPAVFLSSHPLRAVIVCLRRVRIRRKARIRFLASARSTQPRSPHAIALWYG